MEYSFSLPSGGISLTIDDTGGEVFVTLDDSDTCVIFDRFEMDTIVRLYDAAMQVHDLAGMFGPENISQLQAMFGITSVEILGGDPPKA